jgi:hypothetical protein
MLRKTLFTAPPTEELDDMAPGRVLRSVWADSDIDIVVWNVHNYDLSRTQARRVAAAMRLDQRTAINDPTSTLLTTAGDWHLFLMQLTRRFPSRRQGSAYIDRLHPRRIHTCSTAR